MISKPLVPPWDDSAKNIVRSQVIHGKRYSYRVLTDKTALSPAPGVIAEPVYSGKGEYSPGIKQNLGVMLHGLNPRGASIYHYFFAPNPVTSIAGRLQSAIAGVKTVQTVCSEPGSFDKIGRYLFSDIVVALSQNTKQKLEDAGTAASRIRLVRPGIEPIDPPASDRRSEIRRAHDLPEQGHVVIFPGDYEFSSAAETVARAIPILASSVVGVTWVFACRIKRAPSLAIRDRIRDELYRSGVGNNVKFFESVSDMPAFVGAADVVVMPAERLYAKMDAPLVLLEAMSQRVPLVLADAPPLDEIISLGAAVGMPPGDPEALADAVKTLIVNRELSDKIGFQGERAVKEVFSAAVMAESIEAIYDEILRS
jgi:glycosyltransferase involved in cell wall biosynthesis